MSESHNKGIAQTFFLHGGDYNPDQWLDHPEIIERDFELMDKANCNTFSIGVFSWTKLEPKDGQFDFAWLDKIFDLCEAHDKHVLLATPTGARPAWLAAAHPETSRVLKDGSRALWGERENHCYTSPEMRKYSARIIQKLAERYADRDPLIAWHVSNEYNGECFCPLCLAEFRKYLQAKYVTLDAFNSAAWSAFWSHTFMSWDEIDPRDQTLDLMMLEWKRFVTARTVDFMKFEVENIHKFSQAPVTTNFMGFYNGLDYWRFKDVCDFISNDAYPSWDKESPLVMGARVAMHHDMNYSMKEKPFLMIESCPGVPEWCGKKIRRPGEFEREMLLALGHGAAGTMYFQWRKGRGAFEKLHGAVVDHDGSDQTMIFKRVAEYGKRLDALKVIKGAEIKPEVALIYDWESRWALMATCGFQGFPGDEKEQDVPLRHYSALWANNVSIAVIEQLSDFSKYKMLVVPSLYMLKKGVAARLKEFAENGGILIVTAMTGTVDETNRVFLGGLPGDGLRQLCGVWAEDIDCPTPGEQQIILNGFRINSRELYPVIGRCELLHAEDADVLATYDLDFYSGMAAITRRKAGKGMVYYIGADLEVNFLEFFYKLLLSERKIQPALAGMPDPVRVTKRTKDGMDYYFLLNFSTELQHLPLPRVMTDLWNGGKKTDRIELDANMSTVICEKARG